MGFFEEKLTHILYEHTVFSSRELGRMLGVTTQKAQTFADILYARDLTTLVGEWQHPTTKNRYTFVDTARNREWLPILFAQCRRRDKNRFFEPRT